LKIGDFNQQRRTDLQKYISVLVQQVLSLTQVLVLAKFLAAPQLDLATQLQYLQQDFPSWDHQALADLARAVGGNFEEARKTLMEWVVESTEESSKNHPSDATEDPISPWQPLSTFNFQPSTSSLGFKQDQRIRGPIGESVPKPLNRPIYDDIMASRLSRKCTGAGMFTVMKLIMKHRLKRVEQPGPHVAGHALRCRAATLPSTPSREEQIEAGEALLRQRCRFLGLMSMEMLDDGNCQFRAMAQELYAAQDHHGVVRRAVVEHLRQNPNKYAPFFGAGEWKEYLRKMAALRTWGDEITLRAAAETFNVRIHIISSTETNWYIKYEPESGLGDGARNLFMTYVSPIHYNTVAPLR